MYAEKVLQGVPRFALRENADFSQVEVSRRTIFDPVTNLKATAVTQDSAIPSFLLHDVSKDIAINKPMVNSRSLHPPTIIVKCSLELKTDDQGFADLDSLGRVL